MRARLGDWNPNRRDPQEDFDEVTMEVDCVRIHPDADLDGTLANNVAVLILRKSTDIKQVMFRNESEDFIITKRLHFGKQINKIYSCLAYSRSSCSSVQKCRTASPSTC